MKQKFANLNRTVASSMVLALLMAISAGQAAAVEPKSGELTSKEVKTLVATANTPAEHMKLAGHYSALAAKHEAEAQEHEALAEQYTKNPTGHEQKHPMSGQTAAHCKLFAEHCHSAAKEMKAMAAAHEDMAKSLTK